MPAPAVINPSAAKPLTAPFTPNKRYVLCVVTNGAAQRVAYVEWPAGATLSNDSVGTLQALPVSSDGLTIPATVLPPATTGAVGVIRKAAAIVAPAQATLVNNTGGSLITTFPAIVGAVYATDAPAIKNAISSLTVGSNTTNARLEDLIAKLQAAGIQT